MGIKEQSTAIADDDKLVVAWIETTWDGKMKLSTAAYQKLLVEYAGGANVDAAAFKASVGDQMDDSYKTANASLFLEALANVDAVIDLTYSADVPTYDFNTFLTNFNIDPSSDLPFITNQRVFRIDAHISGTSNLDWFESRLIHPALAVEGLKRVLKPDSASRKKFFRNIATGEAAEVVSKDACSRTLMTCEPSEYPSELKMISAAVAGGGEDAFSAIGKLVFPSAYIACLISAMLA